MAAKIRRLAKEIVDLQTDLQSGIKLEPVNDSNATGNDQTIDDLSHFKGVFQGPPETPYEGGSYTVDIHIPEKYPFMPPQIKFTTKIWHPNISSVTGAICLDTLGKAWSPIFTLRSALISLQSLLSSPEPADPQDAQVARMLMDNPSEFAAVARQWAVRYAGAPNLTGTLQQSQSDDSPSSHRTYDLTADSPAKPKHSLYQGYNPAMIDRFTPMGFEVTAVVAAFRDCELETESGQHYDLDEDDVGAIMSVLLNDT